MGKRGPQPWEPTDAERRMVEHYVSIGYTQEQIAALLDKCVDTLVKQCRRELDLGKLKVNAQIGGKLFQKAMAGDTASLIFWAKTQMGWKETVNVNGTHNVNVTDDEARRTAEERADRLMRELAILGGAAVMQDELGLSADLRHASDRLQ